MKAQYHVLLGAAAASALIPVLGVNSTFFLVSSVLIDSDHYIDYVYRNGFRDFSVKNMFIFHDLLNKNAQKSALLGLNLMHTIEFLLLVYIAVALTGWTWLMALLWGMLFHMLVDVIYLWRRGILFRRAYSIIEYLIRWNIMKQHGLHPQLPYLFALETMGILPVSPESKIRKAE